jgi:uncharacterized membrane protein YecN with MAPEG domain
MMANSAFRAALPAPVCLWLSLRVIGRRRGAGTRRVRAQANFAENVPFALVLMALAEAGGAPGWVLHPAGAAPLAGRVAHGFGIARTPEDFRFRVGGMAAPFSAIALSALAVMIGLLIGWA